METDWDYLASSIFRVTLFGAVPFLLPLRRQSVVKTFFTNVFQLPKKANNNASEKDVLSTLEFRART